MTLLAGCVILNEKKELLLLHRNTPTNVQWELPGGKVEHGEDPKQTAVRELKEELGLQVEINKLLDKKEFWEHDKPFTYYWFWAEITSGQPQIQEKKFDNFSYFSLPQLQNMTDLSPNVVNLISSPEVIAYLQ